MGRWIILCVERKQDMIKRFLAWRRSRDTRPDWERMADDGMNKFLKFCITIVFFYFGIVTIEALWDRFT